MKKTLVFILLIISNYIHAQSDTSLLPGIILKDIEVQTYSNAKSVSEYVCNSYSTTELKKNDIVIILGTLSCTTKNRNYYLGLYKGENFLIDTADIATNKSKIIDIQKMDKEHHNNYIDLALRIDSYFQKKDTLDAIDELLKKSKQGLVIINDKVFDVSEYTEGTGFEVKILNSSKKTIKYVTFNYVGYNGVDDPVSKFGKTMLTLKGIGPIKYDETASFSDDYVWFTDIVQYAYIKSILVQYMDGTTRLYKNIDAITLSSKSKEYLLIDE
jgi:cytochrome b involved in lipid metabolism